MGGCQGQTHCLDCSHDCAAQRLRTTSYARVSISAASASQPTSTSRLLLSVSTSRSSQHMDHESIIVSHQLLNVKNSIVAGWALVQGNSPWTGFTSINLLCIRPRLRPRLRVPPYRKWLCWCVGRVSMSRMEA
jgi:hypothetical protein